MILYGRNQSISSNDSYSSGILIEGDFMKRDIDTLKINSGLYKYPMYWTSAGQPYSDDPHL